jgi:fatty acid synthase subunit alpha, fungi type
MDTLNIVAYELESYDTHTFLAKEMVFNILGLMHPLLFSITQVEPNWADLNGGMDHPPDLTDIMTCIFLSLN